MEASDASFTVVRSSESQGISGRVSPVLQKAGSPGTVAESGDVRRVAGFRVLHGAGSGAAQAASLRATRAGTHAKKVKTAAFAREWTTVDAGTLRKGDFVLVETGDMIPTDGEAVAGIATVDESAITGESAPVIRESGGDRSAVTGGTRVLSDWLVIQVVADPGETFLDRMIGMVEGASRKKTPNEIGPPPLLRLA